MGDLGECISLIELPKPFRQRVLVLAHEKGGHLSRKKLGPIINRSFVLPGLTGDVAQHCAQYELCQKMSHQGLRKAPMVERQLLSIPFECCRHCGSIPQRQRRSLLLLTYICLALRWPDAVPMRSMTVKAVVDAFVTIFSWIRFPLSLLIDQGTQFTGGMCKELCRIFGVSKLQTTAYRPQSNGVVERLHGTLVPMLHKAVAVGRTG